MATNQGRPTVDFGEDYHGRREAETPCTGWLAGVTVRFEGGPRYKLCFYDPVRLQMDLSSFAEAGHPYVAEPGLIVLPEVSTESILRAIDQLAGEWFFDGIKPLDDTPPIA